MGAIFAAAHAALAAHQPLKLHRGTAVETGWTVPAGHGFTKVRIDFAGKAWHCLVDGDRDDGYGIVGVLLSDGEYWWSVEVLSDILLDKLNAQPWSAE